MSSKQSSSLLLSTVRKYFPNISLDGISQDSRISGCQASSMVYKSTVYHDSEKSMIESEVARVEALETANGDQSSQKEGIVSLNDHLASRTTLLGTKASIVDAMLYFKLASTIKNWSPEERTGQHGYHHIIRHADFVQNSATIGLSISDDDKIPINPADVIYAPKMPDVREEKERKKKEKALTSGDASGNTKAAVDGKQTQEPGQPSGAAEHGKPPSSETLGVHPPTSAAGSKKDKKEKQPKQQKQPAKGPALSPALIDFRVGHILKAIAHPNADSLFVSTIAVGDPAGTENTTEYEGQIVRTVCSGLNGLVPLEEMQNRKIVAVCNLKPVTMRGIKSAAMVLAASPRLTEGEVDNHAGPVELVEPPEGTSAGQRLTFEGWDGEPEPVLNPKKKIWDMCQLGFTTNENLDVVFEKGKVEQLQAEEGKGKPDVGNLVVKGGGVCKVKTLKQAVVR